MFKKNLSNRLMLLVAAVLCNMAAFAASVITVGDVSIKPGETKDVTISLDTEAADVYQVDGFIALPAGLSFVSANGNAAAITERTQGFTVRLKPSDGHFNVSNFNGAPMPGKTGAIAIFRVKADENLVDGSEIVASNFKVWYAADGSEETSKCYNGKVTIAQEPVGSVAFAFATSTVSLAPGRSTTVGVLMTNESSVTGFQAILNLPAGVTASVSSTGRLNGSASYTPASGKIFYWNDAAIKGTSGVLFYVTLTANSAFTADGIVTMNNIVVTNPASSSIEVAPITLTVTAKDEAAKAQAEAIAHDLHQQLADKKREIARNYPDAANDYELVAEEDAIEDEIYDLDDKIAEDYENNTLDVAEIQGIANGISQEIAALDAKAKEIQDNADGYANLLDELDELRQKLADAMDQMPSDLPKAVTKGFSDEADDIEDDIDDLEDEAEDAYEDGELTADAKLDPANKKAILDDIAALLADIQKWLRGDVAQNQKVEMPDFYALADSILKENLPTDLASNAFYRFDANADQELNVGDMQGIVNIVLGMDAYGNAARQAEAVEASLSVETMQIGNITRYTLNLTGMEYTAFQMDVNGRVVAENADGVSLRSADLKNGNHRVLGFGTKNGGTVLCIDAEGQAQFSNIVFTTANAQTVKFNLGTTGIANVKAAAENGQAYDLSGRAVKNGKGVVIVDGKKVIR